MADPRVLSMQMRETVDVGDFVDASGHRANMPQAVGAALEHIDAGCTGRILVEAPKPLLDALREQLRKLDRFSINEIDDMLQQDEDGDLVSLASVLAEVDSLLTDRSKDAEDVARLIAAAQDLLAALKEIMGQSDIVWCPDMGPEGEGWRSPERMAMWARVEAAIAKAEG